LKLFQEKIYFIAQHKLVNSTMLKGIFKESSLIDGKEIASLTWHGAG
jgi:hypothetical protein